MTLFTASTLRRLALSGLISTALAVPAATSFAADKAGAAVQTDFVATTATDGRIREGASAFRRGEFKKAAVFTQAAINGRLSPAKKAIAQSNLCAAYGALGQMEAAKTACDTALALRPNLAPALQNRSVLSVKLAAIETAKTSIGAQ